MTLLGVALLAAAVLPAPVSAKYGPKFTVPRARLNSAMECYRPPERLGKPPVLLVHGTATGPEPELGLELRPAPSRPSAGPHAPWSSRSARWATCRPRRSTWPNAIEVGFAAGRRPEGRRDRSQPGRRTAAGGRQVLARRAQARGRHDPAGSLEPWGDRGGLGSAWSSATRRSGSSGRTSQYLAALNRGDETPGKISYTTIWSTTDELVQPSSTAALEGASNNSIQSFCPGRIVNHAAILFDPTTYALVNDALKHKGPADPAAVTEETCSQIGFPGAAWSAT